MITLREVDWISCFDFITARIVAHLGAYFWLADGINHRVNSVELQTYLCPILGILLRWEEFILTNVLHFHLHFAESHKWPSVHWARHPKTPRDPFLFYFTWPEPDCSPLWSSLFSTNITPLNTNADHNEYKFLADHETYLQICVLMLHHWTNLGYKLVYEISPLVATELSCL